MVSTKILVKTVAFFLTATLPLVSQALPSYCNSETVHEITRPYANSSGTFTYRYSIGSEVQPNDPVVIFVPGGPGQTSMDMSIAIPNEFILVRTDPRGVGCNEVDGLTDEDFNSEVLARDVLAIVRDLKLKKYMIHGISYGTIVATMAASLAESENTLPPSTLVLEGVIGKAFQPGEYSEGYFQNWKNVKPLISDSILNLFNYSPLPFGLSSQEWAAWISSNLIYGILPSGDNYLLNEISNLDGNHSLAEKRAFKNRVLRAIAPPTPAKTRIYQQIACREMVPDVHDVKFDFDFINGDLVATDRNLCTGLSLDRPFDAKKYPVKSPIYYFTGDTDPVTPLYQAQYHFDSQSAHRSWVVVSKGGHQALSANLADCSRDVWMALYRGSDQMVSDALRTCAAPTRTERK